jgi:YaiO family outer membrane protein
MKSTLLLVAAFMLAAALAIPGQADEPLVAPSPSTGLAPSLTLAASATPAPQPSPAATFNPLADSTEIEGGLTGDALSNNKGGWDSQYLTAMFSAPRSASTYVTASNNNRFGYNDADFEAGTYVPTATPHGTLELMAAVSPQHNILPSFNYLAGYDLRAGGGMGYDYSVAGRHYSGDVTGSLQATIQTVGVNKYFGNDYVDVSASFAKLSNVPGVATSYAAKWATYRANDSFSVTATLGKDIENTGNAIAVFQTTGVDADDLHWFSKKFAWHAGLGVYNLAGAYSRIEARFGIRERI